MGSYRAHRLLLNLYRNNVIFPLLNFGVQTTFAWADLNFWTLATHIDAFPVRRWFSLLVPSVANCANSTTGDRWERSSAAQPSLVLLSQRSGSVICLRSGGWHQPALVLARPPLRLSQKLRLSSPSAAGAALFTLTPLFRLLSLSPLPSRFCLWPEIQLTCVWILQTYIKRVLRSCMPAHMCRDYKSPVGGGRYGSDKRATLATAAHMLDRLSRSPCSSEDNQDVSFE